MLTLKPRIISGAVLYTAWRWRRRLLVPAVAMLEREYRGGDADFRQLEMIDEEEVKTLGENTESFTTTTRQFPDHASSHGTEEEIGSNDDKDLFFSVPGLSVETFMTDLLTGSPTGKKVVVNGKDIALFYCNGFFYAVDEHCPHLGGPLHLGDIEDLGKVTESPRIVCPWHKWCFELATGRQLRPLGRGKNIHSYPVRTDDSGKIFIGFQSIDPACFSCSYSF